MRSRPATLIEPRSCTTTLVVPYYYLSGIGVATLVVFMIMLVIVNRALFRQGWELLERRVDANKIETGSDPLNSFGSVAANQRPA